MTAAPARPADRESPRPATSDVRCGAHGRPQHAGVAERPSQRPPRTMARISVVICAHTEQRWNETLAAVGSVREQSLPSNEIIVVVDHNPSCGPG